MQSLGEENESKASSYGKTQESSLDPPMKPKRNKYAIACSILASMSSVLLGYDSGVMSGAQLFIKDDLKISDVQIEILVGTINIYSIVGSMAAGYTSDRIGRRLTIVVASAFFFVGAILMGFATNYIFLMVGRFVAGIGVGYALTIAPLYAAEVSPTSSRGFLTSFAEVFINVGVLLGFISNYAFSKLPVKLGWRFMLGLGALPSALLAIGVLAMPESPRWLVMQGRLGEAKKVLDRTSESPKESQIRLANIKEVVGIPENCQDDIVTVPRCQEAQGVWRELLLHPKPSVKHILLAGLGIHFFQQSSGIDACVLYSPIIFGKAGIHKNSDKLLTTVAVGFSKASFTLVATFLLDKIGRRPLLLVSAGGMILSQTGLGIGLTAISNSNEKVTWAIVLCVFCVLSCVAFFSIGMGPIPWVYNSEIYPLRLRAQGCSLGAALNRLTSGVLLMTFISLYKSITIGGAFLLYAGIATMAWVFFYTLLPETQGRSLEEMEALFGTFFRWRSKMRELDRNDREGRKSNDGGDSIREMRSTAQC